MSAPFALCRAGIAGTLLVALTCGLTDPARGQFGGGSFGEGGGLGTAEEHQLLPHGDQPPHPLSAAAARTWLALQKPVDLPFSNETPLEDFLDYVQQITRAEGEEGCTGISIYADPHGLSEAEKSLTSPISIELAGVPLVTALRLALKQLDLTYYVQEDGIVVVTSGSSLDLPSPDRLVPVTAEAAAAWLALHEPITLSFPEEAPFADVLRAIRQRSHADDGPHLHIYVDPQGLQMAEKTMESPVMIDLDGVPLATALSLITAQIGLDYRVREDGIVAIRAEEQFAVDQPPPGHGSDTIAYLEYVLREEELKAKIAETRVRIRQLESGGMSGYIGGGGFQSRPAR